MSSSSAAAGGAVAATGANAAGMTHKAKRELDAARKAGVLPPEQDAKTGELINPHIPEFMAKAPWYLSQGSAPTLAHQRKAEEQRKAFGFESYYRRGEFAGQATAYRKGACRNCGSATHKEKDCVERPRAVGAWKTNRDIAPDEILQPSNVALDFDSKRDRWAGYDVESHGATIARYEAAEEERRRIREEAKAAEAAAAAAAKEARRAEREARRAERRAAKAAGGSGSGSGRVSGSSSAAASAAPAADGGGDAASSSSSSSAAAAPVASRAAAAAAAARPGDDDATASEASDTESDTESDTGTDTDTDTDASGDDSADSDADVRQRDSSAVLQQDVKSAGTQKKMTVRNLRVREDTAKYLHNLDVNSAYYDPKTRSMRENPFEDVKAPEGVAYRGDLAVKASGGAASFAQDQVFAWDAAEAGADGVHLQANPTQLALLKKQFEERKAALAAAKAAALADRYGAAEGVEAIPPELRMGQGEGYVEFGADGRPLAPKGAPAAAAGPRARKSVYEEDVWPGNHTSVFGSWYDRETQSWGFACCHATLVSSYCTGAAGRAAREDAERFARSASSAAAGGVAGSTSAAAAAGGGSGSADAVPRSSLYGEQEAPQLDASKMAAALAKYEREQARAALAAADGGGDDGDDAGGGGRGGGKRGGAGSKRGYNSLSGDADAGGTTAEDIEVYKLKRARAGDPMAGPGSGTSGYELLDG